MSRRVVGALVVLLAVAAGGVLFVGGFGPGESPGAPMDGSSSDATTTADVTTDATTTDSPSSGGNTNGSAAPTTTTRTASRTVTPSDYRFTIEEVQKCGTTCRDVTARLANADSETRRNVRVTTNVYADGDLLWSGNETVGDLAPGEAHTSTKRVDVGLSGGMKIQNNDGYVTIVTVVRSDDGTIKFLDRRQVA